MVWSKWIASVVVAMAWAGLAWSQQPSPAPSAGECLLTLKEKGGTARRCRVIVAWTMPEGGKALQVQDVESGEMITIAETGANKAKRIIHWGKHTTPPPGVPVPPAVEPVHAEAPKVEAPKTELPRVEAPKAEAAPAAPIIINGSSPAAKAESAALPVIINAPPPSDVAPTVLSERPSPSPAPPGGHVAERVQVIVPPRTTPDVVASPPPVTPPEIKLPAQVVETRPPSEWRESWGKTASASEAAPPLVPPPSQGRPNPQTTPGFFPTSDPRQAVQAQAQAVPVQQAQPLDGRVQRVPSGMQSVVAAGDGPAQYMPVPIMTQPPVTRMPQPPNPVRQPQGMPGMPPQEQFVNAFTPPPQEQPPMPMAGYGMYPRGVMQTGFVPPMIRNPYPQVAMGGPMVPMGYPGPIPPTPYGAPSQPSMQMLPPVNTGYMEQQLAALKNALFPSHREMAAIQLTAYNAQYYPQVVRALVMSAKDDPAASVRAACVNGLVKLRANTPEVIGVLNQLRNDDDPRVRQEVDQAMARMAPSAEPHNLQPAQATQMQTQPEVR
jgi:hypothetical protein